MKFLKNFLKGKHELQNQTGSEWFAWKNQYYMLHYQPLIIYVVILRKFWKSFAGFKQYTFCVHNCLGKGARKVIPSCSVWKIRNEYKADNDVYVPFKDTHRGKAL